MLCKVMTRARENLFMSYAKSRRVYGQEEFRPVSRFIGEIPEELISANAAIKRPAFLDRYADKYISQKKEDVFPNYEDSNT